MEIIKNIFKIDFKKFNLYTILSILIILIGLLMWISHGIRYNIWTDIGIYSITIFFILSGVLGVLISLHSIEEK